MLNIGFLSIHNPLDRNCFSGTTYYMLQALKQLPDTKVKIIGEAYLTNPNLFAKILRKITRICGGHGHQAIEAYIRKRSLKKCIQACQEDLSSNTSVYDVILVPVSSDLLPKLIIESLPPVIFITDATASYVDETYDLIFDKDHAVNERIMFEIADRILFSSEFMVKRALNDYPNLFKDNNEKVNFLPFGLNMEPIAEVPPKDLTSSKIYLLFVGKEWERKGGDIALDTIKVLREQGYDAQLTIVGCNPSNAQNLDSVTIIPFLNKNLAHEQQQYHDLLVKSHFLILPTKSDCTPMVVAEANAFGMPALVTNIGGLPTIVRQEINGYLFKSSDGGERYAQIIAILMNDKEKYTSISLSSRNEYETKLNWRTWAAQIKDISLKLIAGNTST